MNNSNQKLNVEKNKLQMMKMAAAARILGCHTNCPTWCLETHDFTYATGFYNFTIQNGAYFLKALKLCL